jgi:hypothetical protein
MGVQDFQLARDPVVPRSLPEERFGLFVPLENLGLSTKGLILIEIESGVGPDVPD